MCAETVSAQEANFSRRCSRLTRPAEGLSARRLTGSMVFSCCISGRSKYLTRAFASSGSFGSGNLQQYNWNAPWSSNINRISATPLDSAPENTALVDFRRWSELSRSWNQGQLVKVGQRTTSAWVGLGVCKSLWRVLVEVAQDYLVRVALEHWLLCSSHIFSLLASACQRWLWTPSSGSGASRCCLKSAQGWPSSLCSLFKWLAWPKQQMLL